MDSERLIITRLRTNDHYYDQNLRLIPHRDPREVAYSISLTGKYHDVAIVESEEYPGLIEIVGSPTEVPDGE